jgi:hypothetical protein
VDDVPHNTKVTVRAGSQLVHSVTSRNPLVIEGGLLAVNASSHVANSFTLVGGTLQGPGDLTVDALFQWSGGCMFVGRTLARSGLLVSGGADKCMRDYVLDNAGQASFREGALILQPTATINNLAGATFKIGDVCLCGGTFNNQGTLDKISGAGTAQVQSYLNNAGSVLIHSGGLNLLGGGEASGSHWSNLGTQLTLASSYALTNGANLDGPGRPVRIESGEVSVDGSVIAKNLDIVGGTLRVNGTLTAHDLDLVSGALEGKSEFGAQVTATHEFTWTGGALSDDDGCLLLAMPSGARLVRTGGTARVSCLFIRNSGSVLWAPTVQFDEDHVDVDNAPGATFELRGTRCLCGFFGVQNEGRLVKSGTAASLVFRLNNGPMATVEVQAGELQVMDSFLSSGLFTTSAGALLHFLEGRNTGIRLADGVVFDGPGDVRIDTGVFPEGRMRAKNLEVAGGLGLIEGPGLLTVTDRLTLRGNPGGANPLERPAARRFRSVLWTPDECGHGASRNAWWIQLRRWTCCATSQSPRGDDGAGSLVALRSFVQQPRSGHRLRRQPWVPVRRTV